MKIIKLNNPNFNKDKLNELMSKNICFIGVFSKLCIHCKNMKPEWEKLKNKLKKLNCNGLLLEIDSSYLYSIDNKDLSNKINGLPSILIYKNSKVIKDYNGERKSSEMLKFFRPYIIINNKTRKVNICKDKKNGVNGCRRCCSKFKSKKRYKACKKLCMKN